MSNPIHIENIKEGTVDWQLSKPAGKREIEGYASATSVNVGGSFNIFVNTSSEMFSYKIFRMGWYQGLGARLMAGEISHPGTIQITPKPDEKTGLVECDWKDPIKIQVSHDWTSGVYLIKLEEKREQIQSYIIFIVRNDINKSDILFQIPITTYQAYNYWGGKSLYDWGCGEEIPWGTAYGDRASKVSFNRPYAVSNYGPAVNGVGAGEFLTNIQPIHRGYPISGAAWNYNMVRWIEKNGYDVNYCTNIDTHNPSQLKGEFKLFLSQGHDEYWSQEMRTNITNARDQGLGLAFFGANNCYWQIRLESGIIDKHPYKTMVCYKDADSDPIQGKTTTVNFRDPPVFEPEASFIGVQFFDEPVQGDIVISNCEHPIFKGTSLKRKSRLTGLLGYEVDGVTKDSPDHIEVLATSRAKFMRQGNNSYKSHLKSFLLNTNNNVITAISIFLIGLIYYLFTSAENMSSLDNILFHIAFLLLIVCLIVGLLVQRKLWKRGLSHMTLYSAKSGAKVFSTGSIQWSWGLDDYQTPELRPSLHDDNVEIITKNVLKLSNIEPHSTK